VLTFGRKLRLITANAHVYGGVGQNLVSTSEQLRRIAERLMYDWILVPPRNITPSIEACVESSFVYNSVGEGLDAPEDIISCSLCEGRWNLTALSVADSNAAISTLKRDASENEGPILAGGYGGAPHSYYGCAGIKSGDLWFCKNCITSKCWGTDDPRIGVAVSENEIISEVLSKEGTLAYVISDKRIVSGRNTVRTMSLKEVDAVLGELFSRSSGEAAPARVNFVTALCESQGYNTSGLGSKWGASCGNRTMDNVPYGLQASFNSFTAELSMYNKNLRDLVTSLATLAMKPE
jgi:hypothetical protein